VHRRDAERLGSLCDELIIVDAPIYTLREQFQISRAAYGFDLLHVPHFNVPICHRGPLLVSIHDVIHLMDPSVRQRPLAWSYARMMLEIAVRKSAHIVTVSEYSKLQIIDRLRIAPTKITVIYNGVSARFTYRDREQPYAEVTAELSVPRHYILVVGNLKPHKNVKKLLQAFALLRRGKKIDHNLVIVGDDVRYKPGLIEESLRLGIAGAVLFLAPVRDDLMPKLYAAADLLVMPSTLEGFGLPVVEAMACGTPVACSNAASLPEVAGDAAEYFEPRSMEGMATAIERVLTSADLQQRLRQKGLAQARKFSWDKCAQQHREIYRSLI
jgi:glycosyltransferase involved in cell wall biosynthesis